MVMPLPRPEDCSLALVDSIVAERTRQPNKALFEGWAAEWRQRVSDYLNHGGSPEHVPTWPLIEKHKAAFHNLYSHPKEGSAHGAVLEKLRQHELDLCPACGEPGTPNTLDHYLPKGRFPHFSITPANLFPMCDACQGAKLEKTGDEMTPRYFIHPYFDTFSTPQLFKLKIDTPFDAPIFSLTPNPILADAERVLVGTHLRELNVVERYIIFFRNEHRRLLRQAGKMRASGQDVVGTLQSFASKYEDPTPNSWQHVFYDGALSNADFLDFLKRGALPGFL